MFEGFPTLPDDEIPMRPAYDNIVANHLIEELEDVYNKKRSKYATSTAIKKLVKESAADLKWSEDNPDNEVKPAYILGDAVHSMVLEGLKKYDEKFILGGPKNDDGEEFGMKSEAFKEARVKVNKTGKELIRKEEHGIAMKMRRSCLKHDLVKDILSEGVAERVIRTNYMGIDCQVRFDWLSPEWGIPDLKTCRDIFLFKREARFKYGYLYQAGFYQTIAYHVAPEFGYLKFCFIVVESKPPYKVGVFQVTEEDLEYYRNGVMDALIYLKKCRETGVYPTGFEDIQTI